MTWFHRILRERKGFTLVELLLVVAILGILATLAVTRIDNSLATARTNRSQSNLAVVQSAVERYRAEEDGNWPTADGTCDQSTDTIVLIEAGTNTGTVNTTGGVPQHFADYFGRVPNGTFTLKCPAGNVIGS